MSLLQEVSFWKTFLFLYLKESGHLLELTNGLLMPLVTLMLVDRTTKATDSSWKSYTVTLIIW